MTAPREMLRHTVATLAYRGAKATRGAPASFASFQAGPSSRTPVQILAHIGDLMDWALTMARDTPVWRDAEPRSWDEEVARFHAAVQAFDDYLASEAELRMSAERLFQGPVADALTHVGQIAMLRRLAGCPMKGENYARADIAIGRVGPEQVPANPRVEFD